jgi:formylglycine-generating enzyme required for sulfatase activity
MRPHFMTAAFLEEAQVRFHHLIAVGLTLACTLAPACAEKRVALVIGNERYTHLPAREQLQKAVNDARAVSGVLKGIGFEVLTGENLDRRAMLGWFDELVQRLEPGDTAFFFFSGHGVALDGVNYMLPADVPDVAPGQDALLKREALDEPYITSELTGRGVRVAILVLDACRTNPFVRFGKGVGVARGLAPPPQVSGVFSLYAAAAGQAALDRLSDGDANPNSVFSRVLVPMLAKPGLDLRELAFEVRQEVARIAEVAGHVQRPEDYDRTVGGKFYLAGALAAATEQPVSSAPADAERAAQTWALVKDSTSVAALDDFIARFGNVPIYGPLARARREEVAKLALVAALPSPLPSLPPRSDAPLTPGQERGLKPKDTFRECANCPEMVVVPAGSFTMGSPEKEEGRWNDEGPQHVVTIGEAFAAGKWHVTVDQFAAFVRETGYASTKCYKWPSLNRDGSWRDPGFAQEGSHPVVCVSWDDANAYVEWVAKTTGKPYRLLSEAEFEYAARGQTSPGAYKRFWFGNDEKEFCQNGNGADQKARDSIAAAKNWTIAPCNDGYAYTSPAGHYTSNAFGLYDMAGNAWQWTADCYHDSYNGAPADGSAWTDKACNSDRVARGGSWDDNPRSLRAAHRGKSTGGNDFVGFRLARTLGP